MEQVTVLESLDGKFGPQLKDAKGYLSFSKKYKGDTKFAPGTVLDADLFVSDKGNRYINKATPKDVVEVVKLTPLMPKTEVEKPVKVTASKKVETKKVVAFGRELSDYELQKDRRIGVAGVVQAVIGSEWYAQQAALTDLANPDSVKALREFAKEEANYWLDVIQERSI